MNASDTELDDVPRPTSPAGVWNTLRWHHAQRFNGTIFLRGGGTGLQLLNACA